MASDDPQSFLDANPPPVILDEVQNVPHLLSYIKERVDERREDYGAYILTGSQNLLLIESITQSLAGRAGILRLLPFSQAEAAGQPGRTALWEQTPPWESSAPAVNVWARIFRGSFPQLVENPAHDADFWHSSYIQTYLERDVRSLRQIGDLALFQNYLRALALRSGQLLNLSDLARDLGISANTVQAWTGIMEASHQVVVLRPYFRNAGKRLVKRPKVYFVDTGTLCHLLGMRDEKELRMSPLAGAVFETAVFSELYKYALHHGADPRMYFWRTAMGDEVDFVIDRGNSLVPVEAKASSTPAIKMARGIAALNESYRGFVAPGFVVYSGEQAMPLGKGTIAVPFDAM
jgi:hypothetical protein